MPGNYNEGNTYTVDEQVAFASYMTQSLTDAGIPFAINADSHFYDREQHKWLEDMQPVFMAMHGISLRCRMFTGVNCFPVPQQLSFLLSTP